MPAGQVRPPRLLRAVERELHFRAAGVVERREHGACAAVNICVVRWLAAFAGAAACCAAGGAAARCANAVAEITASTSRSVTDMDRTVMRIPILYAVV